MDRPITGIPGLENLMRRRDLPSVCRFKQTDNLILQFFLSETAAMTKRSSPLILNTSYELESASISRLRSIFPEIYTVGPLHALSKSLLPSSPPPDAGSLRQQDRICIQWLDSQPPKSVIYVSFGSIVVLSREQVFEFWHGLVDSGKRFLWALRPDAIAGEDLPGGVPRDLAQGTAERGCLVGWAPQEEVLGHWAVGGFLTHCGWNSTVESIVGRVPMLCWPLLADQQVNSRCVSEVWRVGVDMKDRWERATVERMVREVMEDRREEIVRSMEEIGGLVSRSFEEGGSSRVALRKLVEDIRAMHSKSIHSTVDPESR